MDIVSYRKRLYVRIESKQDQVFLLPIEVKRLDEPLDRNIRIVLLRVAGWTFARIGEDVGLSTNRVLQICKKAEHISRMYERWHDDAKV